MNRSLVSKLLVVVFFFSCSLGADQKVENAVKEMEEKRFKNNDEKVESFSIDSLRYEPASMQNFYSDYSDDQVAVLETYSERLQTVTDTTQSPMKDALQAKAQRQL